MSVDRAELASKREDVAQQLASLRGDERIVRRLGGATILSMSENIRVQEERLAHLDWMLQATDDEIAAKMAQQVAALGLEAIDSESAKAAGGSVEAMLAKGLAELTQLALGEHRVQKARVAAAERARQDARVPDDRGLGVTVQPEDAK